MTFQIHGTSCGYNSVLAANSPQASSRTRKQKSAGLAKLAAMKSSLFDDDSSHLSDDDCFEWLQAGEERL